MVSTLPKHKPKQRDNLPKPFPVRIHAPGPRPGLYHGMVLDCLGLDKDGLFMVPLPAIGSRPAYLGKFPARCIIMLDADEGDYADF